MPGFKYRGIFTFRDPGPVGTANLLPAAGKNIGKAGPFFQMGILHQFIFLEMGLDDQVIIRPCIFEKAAWWPCHGGRE